MPASKTTTDVKKMSKVGLVILLLFIPVLTYGQKLEYAVHLNSGIFHYNGKSATRSSDIVTMMQLIRHLISP